MLCEFCTRPFTRKGRQIYCSSLCNKRSWYVRHIKRDRSVFTDNPILGIELENWFIRTYKASRPSRSLNTPADFVFEGKTVDLKVSNLGGKYPHWTFRKAGKGVVDEYICICLLENKPFKMYRIEAKDFPKKGMSVGRNRSKYDEYLWKP
jgi:hypothetical protein